MVQFSRPVKRFSLVGGVDWVGRFIQIGQVGSVNSIESVGSFLAVGWNTSILSGQLVGLIGPARLNGSSRSIGVVRFGAGRSSEVDSVCLYRPRWVGRAGLVGSVSVDGSVGLSPPHSAGLCGGPFPYAQCKAMRRDFHLRTVRGYAKGLSLPHSNDHISGMCIQRT